MAEEEASSNDLPLSANLQDIVVKHFVLDLSCHMSQQVFEGSVTLWCLPAPTAEIAESQKNTREDPVVSCAAEDSTTECMPSATPELSRTICCELSRVTCLAEKFGSNGGGGNWCLGFSDQIHCADTGTDSKARDTSVGCVQSLHSNNSDSVMVAKAADEIVLTGETTKCIERVKRCACSDRNSGCGCVPCQTCAGDGSTVHSVVELKAVKKDQTGMCGKCTNERNLSSSLLSSSGHDPDFVRKDTCCHGPPGETHTTVMSDFPGCLKSDSACDTGKAGITQEETVVQHSASLSSLSFSHDKCTAISNRTGEVPGCLKSDLMKCDNSLTNDTHQDNEEVNRPVSQNHSAVFLNKDSSALNPTASGQSRSFRMILDSYKLDIQNVEGLYLQGWYKSQFEEHPDEFVQQIHEKDSAVLSRQHRCQMQFLVKEHCVEVFREEVHSPQQFPHAVQIWYRTHPSGSSLKWTKDQDDHPCVFTLGHFLSNRSLFPSQDFPTALPTWRASITVDQGLTVLLTGDVEPHITVTDNGRKTFSYFTKFPMPSSTFAIAVGSWEMEILQYGSLLDDVLYQNVNKPALQLFFPEGLKEKSLLVLGRYLPRCMLEVQGMLGRYPFHRLDVLIVPACFDSLGMASPSLLFLSQSILCRDGSMCVRVAHELCHTWFGLVMGPRDWTEEWMTEGFCTYLEDILHAQVVQPGEAVEDLLGLRAELHLRVLKAEMDNTDESLQCLRPNKGKWEPQSSGEETRFLKNGMNVEKKFMQVHYLKGYFLLHALATEVGRVEFLSFLKEFVHRYLYQLVTSQEFLQMFFATFTHLKHLSVDSINADWLDCPGIPKGLVDKDKDTKNTLSAQVQQQLTPIISICRRPQRKRRHGRQLHHRKQKLPELNQLQTPQVVVLMDHLLEERQVPGQVLDLLRDSYGLHLDNAEVCHRWCELVIKHRHKKWYPDVEHFLIHHQAMGVYLYGEASISQRPDLVQLARACFRQLQPDMPESVHDTVSAMLYGT